jgi:hypothetical protein
MQQIITRRSFVITLGMVAVPLITVAQEKTKDNTKSRHR